jgi:hypothetical protein
MKWLITLALVLTLQAQPALAQDGPCTGRWNTHRQVRQGIECVWDRFDPGYGGAAKAIDVASCESGLNPEADGGASEGLFQHMQQYWPTRFTHYIERHTLRSTWGLSPSIWSGRSQAVVTALMVRRGGWGPWTCA